MQHRGRLASIGSLCALLLVATGCSATDDPARSASSGDSSTGIGGGGAGGMAGGGAGGEPGVGGSFTGGASAGGGSNELAEVFGESAENLFRLDPNTKEVSLVGPFSPPGEGAPSSGVKLLSNSSSTTIAVMARYSPLPSRSSLSQSRRSVSGSTPRH